MSSTNKKTLGKDWCCARAPLHLLFDYSFLRLFLVFVRVFFCSCRVRACVSDLRETGNKSFVFRIHILTAIAWMHFRLEEKKKTEPKQKRRKQVMEITFNFSMFVRCMSVAPKCGIVLLFQQREWRSRQKVHTRQIEDLRNAINATTDNSFGWCRARYSAAAAKKAIRHSHDGTKTQNWIEIKVEVARQRLFKTHSLSG